MNPGQGPYQHHYIDLPVCLISLPLISIMHTISTQSTNRTVFTFVGDPSSVVEAALAAAKVVFIIIIMDVIVNIIFSFVA